LVLRDKFLFQLFSHKLRAVDLTCLRSIFEKNYPVVRAPVVRDSRLAAVMVVLYANKDKIFVLMTLRSKHLKIHPGEMSFPGGRYEDNDGDLLSTALRETKEEIGLDLGNISVNAKLPVVTTLTGYKITPYVAIVQERPRIGKLSDEVESAFEIPLFKLLSTKQRYDDVGENMYVFWHGAKRIWGASAKVLQEIERLCSISDRDPTK